MTLLRELSVSGYADAAPTQYVTANGIRFAYRMFGKPGGVTLLLCQRFRGTMDDWDPLFLDTLAADRRIVIFDNAGVGRSSGESPTTIAGMADHAAALIDALGLDRVDVLGWSMGGAVAQALTLHYPRLVRRLVVAGSGPGGVPRAPVADIVMKTAAKPVNGDDDFLFLFFDGSEARRAAGKEHLGRLHHRIEPPSPLTRKETVMAMVGALRAWSSGGVLASLDQITQPVLVANGAHDVMVPSYDSFAMVEKLPDAELLLYSDAGHGFLFQHAERFGQRVNQFLG
jgi:pimeloyl-ACP methyl ester carboxylesterase